MASPNVYYSSNGDFEEQNQFDSLLGSTRQRRIGGNTPYRDDPVSKTTSGMMAARAVDTKTRHALVFLCLHSSHTSLSFSIDRMHHLHHLHFHPNKPQQRQMQQRKNRKRRTLRHLPFYKRCYHSCLDCLRNHGCSSHSMKQQEGVDGLYYRDYFNDSSWSCSIGTTDDAGIWMNNSDQAGTIMACLVWLLLSTYVATCIYKLYHLKRNMIPILFL